jgi:hypothetical protein
MPDITDVSGQKKIRVEIVLDTNDVYTYELGSGVTGIYATAQGVTVYKGSKMIVHPWGHILTAEFEREPLHMSDAD